MSRDPLDAFRAADTPVPIPEDAAERIQQRMFDAFDAASVLESDDARAGEDSESSVLESVDVLTVDPSPASSWSKRNTWLIAAAASVVVIVGIALLGGGDDDTAVDTGPVADSTDLEEVSEAPPASTAIDAVCTEYVDGLAQWIPELGSIDSGQVGPAIAFLRPMIDDVAAALLSLDVSEPAVETIRDEVVSIDAQFSAEEADPSPSESIHILPLVARRLDVVLTDLADLGYAACGEREGTQ